MYLPSHAAPAGLIPGSTLNHGLIPGTRGGGLIPAPLEERGHVSLSTQQFASPHREAAMASMGLMFPGGGNQMYDEARNGPSHLGHHDAAAGANGGVRHHHTDNDIAPQTLDGTLFLGSSHNNSNVNLPAPDREQLIMKQLSALQSRLDDRANRRMMDSSRR